MGIDVTIGSTSIDNTIGVSTNTLLNFMDPLHLLPRKVVAPAAAPAAAPVKVDPVVNRVYLIAKMFYNMFSALPEPARSYAVYQTYFETGAYTNNGYNKYNNATGIHFAGQEGATKGPNDYAVFSTWDYYLKAYLHELRKGANPAGATSLEDFVKRLQANNYFGKDNPAQYLSGLKRARLVLKVIPSAERAGYDPGTGTFQDKNDLDIPGSKDYSATDWKDPLHWPTWAKWAGGITAGLVVLKMVTN